MSVLYIREQGAGVHKRGGRLLVESRDAGTLLEIPLRETECVAVFGNVQVSTQAMAELLDRGIPLTLLTRNGRLKGHLIPEVGKNIRARVEQYRMAVDDTSALRLARAIVAAKLWNSAALVREYRHRYPSMEMADVEERLTTFRERVALAVGREELMGIEGAGAAAYFEAFALANRSELAFQKRARHPPPDPVNALLSLGYTLAMNEIRILLEMRGLEPNLGFLHGVDYGRPSLALDLLEPFRASFVDRLTLKLLNDRMLTEKDFVRHVSGPHAGGVLLAPDSQRRYFTAYECAIREPREGIPQGVRAAVEAQVSRLVAALSGKGEFVPFQEGH